MSARNDGFRARWPWGADQMIFGTDVLMPDQYVPQFELYGSLDLPADVRHKIYRGNALRLLKLAGR